MRHFRVLVLALPLLIGACSGSSALMGPEGGAARASLQDGQEPSSNNSRATLQGQEPSSNNLKTTLRGQEPTSNN